MSQWREHLYCGRCRAVHRIPAGPTSVTLRRCPLPCRGRLQRINAEEADRLERLR